MRTPPVPRRRQHAGIPRDADIKAKIHDFAALNDPDLRFQMLWSDPSTADFIPEGLQAQNARFPFGREQGIRGQLNGGWGELRKRDGTIIKQ